MASTAHTRSKATLERRLSHDARATQDDFKSMLDSAEQSDDLALRKLAGRFRRQLCFKAVLGGFVSIFMVPVLLGLLLSLPS